MVSIESLPRASKEKLKMVFTVLEKLSLPHFNMSTYLPRNFIKVAPVKRPPAFPFLFRSHLPILILNISWRVIQISAIKMKTCLTATINKMEAYDPLRRSCSLLPLNFKFSVYLGKIFLPVDLKAPLGRESVCSLTGGLNGAN